MNTCHRRGLFVLLMAAWFTGAAWAADVQEDDSALSETAQKKQISKQARELLTAKNWSELEKWASDLRTQKSRFSGGRWKLESFYGGLNCPRSASDQRDWPAYFAALEEWKAAQPTSPVPLIVFGESYLDYAWEARGSGWANTVTDEGWRLFDERIKKAREYLEAATRQPTQDPQAYRALLVVAKAQGWPRFACEIVFKHGIEVEPTYHALYFAKATYLLPRWHGQPGDVERFAEESIALNKEEGKAMYARIVWNLENTVKKEQFFREYSFSWPRLREGFQELQKQHPKSTRALNAFCLFACMAGDRKTAKPLFDQLGEKWLEEIWGGEATYLRYKKWAMTTVQPETWSEYFRRLLFN